MLSKPVRYLLASLTLSSIAAAGRNCPGANQPLTDLNTAANNSYFVKWRPSYHFGAPNSWQNDPNIGYYDTTTKKWFMGYQYHPNHINWGNISIGGGFSDDMIYWVDAGAGWQNPTVLGTGPLGSPDHLGVFSGGTVEDGYMGFPTAMYTSVQHLPIGWSIPYQPQSETQSIAYTPDNGATWIKYEGNPVIPHPPPDLNVTGWRDPLVFRDANLASALGDSSDQIYTTVSSGERPTSGGRLLLYRAQSSNMTGFDLVGYLFQSAANVSWSSFSGNYGFNFEMGGYRSLPTKEGPPLSVISFGTEGARTLPDGTASHGNHWPLWTAGTVDSSGVLTPSMSGVLDWGETYAYLGVWDPTYDRQLIWYWIYEDDNGYGMTAKGWQGSLGLPRVLTVNYLEGVTDSSATEKGSWDATQASDGTYTIRTLGQAPIPELSKLRKTATEEHFPAQRMNSPGYQPIYTAKTSNYEMCISLDLTDTSVAGLTVRKSPTTCEQTDIYIDVANEEISVDRSKSSLYYQFNNATDTGKFRLWHVDKKLQTLDLHIFVDNSIIEIHANGVFCLTTRIYPVGDDADGIGYLVKGGSADYGEVIIWDGLDRACPERPIDSSVPLVYDNAQVTDNYTYWPGN